MDHLTKEVTVLLAALSRKEKGKQFAKYLVTSLDEALKLLEEK